MKLRDHLRTPGWHSCLMTGFGIGFDAFEAVALPALESAGCLNIAVLTDGRMLTAALGDPTGLPRHAGRHYSIGGAATGALFHPKLWVQIGREGGRLTIGSANPTVGGLSGNLELMTALTCAGAGDASAALIARACTFVEDFADPADEAFAMQRDWMRARAPWLREVAPSEGVVTLDDGTEAALLLSGEGAGIGSGFCDLVAGDRPVRQLIALSPYWDRELAALDQLRMRLAPEETVAMIDREDLFPGAALPDGDAVRVHHHAKGSVNAGRFVHAKALIARTDDHDHLLIGSANCTRAALGTAGFAGSNIEACLYRRLPAGAAVEALGLARSLEKDARIDPADLGDYEEGESIPLDDLAIRNPGRFVLDGAVLRWMPPAGLDPSADQCLDLLDDAGASLATVEPEAGSEPFRYPLDPVPDTLAFARMSGVKGAVPGIVIRTRLLQARLHEPRTGKLGERLADLPGESRAHLSLLEILDMIEKADTAEEGGTGIARASRKRPDMKEEDDDRVLDYAAFVAGRRVAAPGVSDPFDHGDEVSLRRHLDRLVGLSGIDEADEGVADLGDETADTEAALEDGASFDTPLPPRSPAEPWSPDGEAARHRTAIVDAVETLCDRLGEKGKNRTLTPNDLLRLRILLQVICATAWRTSDRVEEPDPDRSVFHALPVESDDRTDWPSLIGRLMFVTVGKPDPALLGLTLPDSFEELPSEVMECLVVGLWTLQACLAAPVSSAQKERTGQFIRRITTKAYVLTGLTREDMLSEPVLERMRKMGFTHADTMGVDAAALVAAHGRDAEALRHGRD